MGGSHKVAFNYAMEHNFDYVIVFAERHAKYILPELFNQIDITEDKRILLVTGPEGGFSQREFELMDEHKLKKVTLGNLILRADTAVIAGVSSAMILASH